MTKHTETRVFRKSSSNGKITVYVGKRDFADYLTHLDPIEGVVLVDPEYQQKAGKVFAHVLAAFSYGQVDLDVLGLSFSKDLFLSSVQVYPPLKEQAKPISPFQDRLIRKLGPNAFPFFFELPADAPSSVMIRPPPGESPKQCGVEFELKVYVADKLGDKAETGTSARLSIRKLTYATEEAGPQPKVDKIKDFFMSPGTLRLHASLGKEKFCLGEDIPVNVCIDNNSSRTVKRIRLSVVQETSLVLHDHTTCDVEVFDAEFTEGFPVQPNQTGFSKVFQVRPGVEMSGYKIGLALDGDSRYADTHLAASTVIRQGCQKEKLGIIVSYRVKVKLILGFGSRDFTADLPFILTNPKPAEDLKTKTDSSFNNLTFEDFAREPATNRMEA